MSDSASELFWDAFTQGGTRVSQCACGITHFASGSRSGIEPEQLEELRQKALKKPSAYIENSQDDSLCIAELSYGPIVYGCTCGISKRHEDFIITSTQRIVKFLTLRQRCSEEQLTAQNQMLEILSVFTSTSRLPVITDKG